MDSNPSSPTTSRPGTPVGALPDNINTARPFRFNWDPSSSRRKGPESVSATTEGRADYVGGAAPRFDFLNTSSTNLAALGSLPQEWSSSKHGFNAISTVLNNPHKRQAPPKAHSMLPTVAPSDLPRVRRKDFDSYLKAITPEWEQYERNCRIGREGVAQLDGPSSSTRSLFSPDEKTNIPPPRRTIPELDTVPSVFFDPAFDLSIPHTFDLVTERTEDDDLSISDPSSLSHSLPLLEKLSHYADTVEQHLVREISLRSTSFFAALTNLNELQAESEQCLDRTSGLRKLLHDVDEKGAKKGLEVVRKEFKLRNLNAVTEGVKTISGVVDMTGVARSLVTAGQWNEALDVIEEMDALWHAEDRQRQHNPEDKTLPSIPQDRTPGGRLSPVPPSPEEPSLSSSGPPNIPISSLQAFSALPNHLRVLTMEITASLISELVSVLQVDLVDRMGEDTPRESLNQTLRDRLKPLLHSLVKTKGVREGTMSWREVALEEIRRAIKRHIPLFEDAGDEKTPSTNGSNSETKAGLGNHLRQTSHADFITLIRSVYASLLHGVEGIQIQSTIILEILRSIQSFESVNAATLEEEFNDIMCTAGELSNMHAGKIVSLRSEQHAALDLPEFHAFFTLSWDFVVQSEVICRRMIVGLRGVVVSQAKVFLQTFHQDRISRSAKFVEDEQWSPVDVSAATQRIVDVLVDAAVRDAAELKLGTPDAAAPPRPTTPLPPPMTPSDSTKTNGSTSGSGGGSKHLKIEERAYFAVQATVEVVFLVRDYLQVIVNLHTLTTETMSRVIEFLKSFNSRTCQVVLGAGAMRSAGLKNITAKHLALASQSLSIMIALIPYIREAFRRHLSSKQAVMLVEFDKLKRDYQEHQNEIHTKLIAIMGDRLSAHIKSLQGLDWSQPGNGVNDYMVLLVKETVTLHKVLSRYLYPPVVEFVMTQVFAAINHRLSEEYSKIELPHQEAKVRLLADAQYLHQKLSVLKNVSLQSGMLEMVISENKVQQSQPSQQQQQQQVQRGASPVTQTTPARSNTLSSANQRLKGLLSGNKSTTEKALPIPAPMPIPLPTMDASAFIASPSPTPSSIVSIVGGASASTPPPPPMKSLPNGSGSGTPPVREGVTSPPRQGSSWTNDGMLWDGRSKSSPPPAPPPVARDHDETPPPPPPPHPHPPQEAESKSSVGFREVLVTEPEDESEMAKALPGPEDSSKVNGVPVVAAAESRILPESPSETKKDEDEGEGEGGGKVRGTGDLSRDDDTSPSTSIEGQVNGS